MNVKERTFPRGGTIPALSKPSRVPTYSLFGKSIKVKNKGRKRRKSERQDAETDGNAIEKVEKQKFSVKYVDDLTPSILHEGMLVLGVIRQVTDKVVSLSLPGSLSGIVKISNVSKFYKKLVVNSSPDSPCPTLSSIFSVGEILPAKVISVTEDDKRTFLLSLDPQLINSKLIDVEKGLILVGSVKSEEDHGYVIDLGIPSVVGFLNFDKVESEDKLPVGKLIRCAVTRALKSQGSSSVELSALTQDIKFGRLSNDSTYPIHSFIPGMQLELTVTKVLRNGVEVVAREDESVKGYVYEEHLRPLFPKLDKITPGTKYIGTLLYVKPLVNAPYFKVFSWKPQTYAYKYGQIVRGKVMKATRAGVTFRLGKKLLRMKCFVPVAKLANADKLVENEVSVESLYPANKIVKQIRLGMVDYMRRCYFGSTDKASIKEKYYSINDLNCGDVVPCVVTALNDSDVQVRIGRCVTGTVAHMDATDIPVKNPNSRFKIDQKVKARVMEIDHKTRFVRLTMKPTLMDVNMRILSNLAEVDVNGEYTGTVFIVDDEYMLVKFFNGIMGKVWKRKTPHRDGVSLKDHYVPGELVKCYVMQCNGEKSLLLSLTPRNEGRLNLKIGEKYEAEVAEKTNDGLLLTVRLPGETHAQGLLPGELLADYPGFGRALLPLYPPKTKLTVRHVLRVKGATPVFAASDSVANFYETLGEEKVEPEAMLIRGRVLPFVLLFASEDGLRLALSCLVPDLKNFRFFADVADAWSRESDMPVRKYQMMYGSVREVTANNFVRVSLSVSDVWDKNYRDSLSLLDSYIDGMKRLTKFHQTTRERYVRRVALGANVYGKRISSKDAIHDVRDACIEKKGVKWSEDETIRGKIVWIKADEKILCVNSCDKAAADINSDQDDDLDLINTFCHARIVYVGDEAVVAALKGKGKGKLTFLPRKRHVNDFVNLECPYAIGATIEVWITRLKSGNLIGIDRRIAIMEEKRLWNAYEENLRKSLAPPKRKSSAGDGDVGGKRGRRAEATETPSGEDNDDDDDDVLCEYSKIGDASTLTEDIKEEVESEIGEYATVAEADVEIKSENDDDDDGDGEGGGAIKDIFSKERIAMSSSSEEDEEEEEEEEEKAAEVGKKKLLNVDFNWDVLKNRELLSGTARQEEEESSSEDEEEEKKKKKKKKRARLTKSEKEEKARAEEERLRAAEERLMKADAEPETADDFDRALLAKPNSSALWVKYMAFHLQATEIEKARTVARRALKTIAFAEEQEKLNVWMALLNLENLYGSEESLGKALSEALSYNDPYHVHVHMMNMHGQSGKKAEMERVGNMLMKKFKDVESMWQDVALAYYKAERAESARNVLQRALPLLDKKKHVELVTKFAQMENRHGSSERAQTLYETVLASFPKRVDVWSAYADMLVKSGCVDLARQVLARATSQHLPPKKMKVLFKKFMDFEEKHGTPERVEKVREAAVEYVQTVGTVVDK